MKQQCGTDENDRPGPEMAQPVDARRREHGGGNEQDRQRHNDGIGNAELEHVVNGGRQKQPIERDIGDK